MNVEIDLDRAAEQIVARTAGWETRGLRVGPLTWRDQARQWPEQIVTGRDQAVAPDSVGFRMTCGKEEGEVVLYEGGWADTEYWGGTAADDIVYETIGYHAPPLTLTAFGLLLDQFGTRFLGDGAQPA